MSTQEFLPSVLRFVEHKILLSKPNFKRAENRAGLF